MKFRPALLLCLLAACARAPREDFLNDPFASEALAKETLNWEVPHGPPSTCPVPHWQQLDFLQSISVGLCHHPETRAAYAAIARRAASWGESQGDYLPTLNLSYRREDSRQKTTVRGEGSSRSRQRPDRRQLELQWLLFDFGARAARNEQNLSQLRAAIAAYDRQLQQRFRTIANNYVDLDTEDRRMAVAQQNVALTAAAVESARVLHGEGVVIAADVSQAEVERDAAQLQYLQAKRDRDNAATALAESMGYGEQSALNHRPLPSDSFSTDGLAHIEQLIDAAMASHPEIREAEASLAATKASLAATAKSGAPQLFLFGSAQNNGPLHGGGRSYRERENVIGLGLRWPLFEGYKRHYQEKALAAQRLQEEAALEALKSRLSLEMRQAHRQLTTAIDKQAIAWRSVAAAELNYETRLGRYRSGVGSLSDLLQAQRSLNSMRLALADANREQHQVALQLLFSVGRAFPTSATH